MFDSRVQEGDPGGLGPECPLDIDPGRLCIHVVFTTAEGTIAALRSAASWAASLGAEIRLLVTEVVYYRYSLEIPPVSPDFLRDRCIALIEAAQLDPRSIKLEIYFCRKQMQCLQLTLMPHSIVVIGTMKRWWTNREQKLERALKLLGHDVFLVNATSSICKSHSRSIQHRLAELSALRSHQK
jgi:hypothetical protein